MARRAWCESARRRCVGVKVAIGAGRRRLRSSASARNAPACTETKHGPVASSAGSCRSAAPACSCRVKTGPSSIADHVADQHLAQACRPAPERSRAPDTCAETPRTSWRSAFWRSWCNAREKPSAVYCASSGCSTRTTLPMPASARLRLPALRSARRSRRP